MHRTITLAIWITALSLLATSLFIFACNDNDDDDNDDDDDEATPDLNGWTDEDGTLTFHDENNQQCPPPMPEGMSAKPIQTILDAYIGSYTDEIGNERNIACNPQGVWEVYCYDDDSFCDVYWIVPVLVTILDQNQTMIGFIDEDHYPLQRSGELYFDYGDQTIWGERFETSVGEFALSFVDSTFGAVWTKQE